MKYFLDTEFIDDGAIIKLLSIGIVAEDGSQFYAETKLAFFYSEEPHLCPDDWVKTNVVPYLGNGPFLTHVELGNQIKTFCNPEIHGKPEFWGYYADYDWVAFCHIFGRMVDLPKDFPMYCRDIKQLCDDMGNPKLPTQEKGEHDALQDALWNQIAYNYLTNNR